MHSAPFYSARMGIMGCEEKTRLTTEYEEATVRIAAAVTDLQRKTGTSPKEEYARLNRAANESRVKSEHARLAVEGHIATHGC
jgi:hypothetical protein